MFLITMRDDDFGFAVGAVQVPALLYTVWAFKIEQTSLFLSVRKAIWRIARSHNTFPAIQVQPEMLSFLSAKLQLVHIFMASPLQKFAAPLVPVSVHTAYAALGYYTQSRVAAAKFPKRWLAIVTGDDIPILLSIVAERVALPRTFPPAFVAVFTPEKQPFEDTGWHFLGNVLSKASVFHKLQWRKYTDKIDRALRVKFSVYMSPGSTVSVLPVFSDRQW